MSFDPVMPPYNAGDPHATFLSSSCFDFLLIELVPMAYRVTGELEAAEAAAINTTGAPPPPPTTTSHHQNNDRDAATSSSSAAAAGGGGGGRSSLLAGAGGSRRGVLDEEEERDAVFYRLETLGYRVGQGLVERYV